VEPDSRLDLGCILKARQEISRVFRDTPQFGCPALGNLLGCELVVKLETANPIRCFKGRGTEVVVSRLARSPGPKVAVCASAGNLGQALAYSGRARGIGVTVIAGTSANAAKIDRIRRLGAAVEVVEGDIENAPQRAWRLGRWAGTSPRRLQASMRFFWRGAFGKALSLCAGWWPSWPSAASIYRSVWNFVHAERLSFKKTVVACIARGTDRGSPLGLRRLHMGVTIQRWD
jgi:hypothetical protein